MGIITLQRAAILLAWLVLANADPPQDYWHQLIPPTDDCLDCICQAEGCECHIDQCHVDTQGVKRCGPFQISEQYWNDCDSPSKEVNLIGPKPPCGLEADTIMHITCNSDCKLFVDGTQLSVDQTELANWQVTSDVPLSAGSQVLAVEADAGYFLGGLLASLDDGTVTDASWKCSSVYEANWASAQYTESSNFKSSTEIESNADKRGMYIWSTRPGITNDAQWIWTETYSKKSENDWKMDTKVYCRKTLGSVCPAVVVPEPPCGLGLGLEADTIMHITCDEDCKLFVDGTQLSVDPTELATYNVVSEVPLSAGSQVLAVEADTQFIVAGFLASFDDGTVTDASWKCSAVYEADWASAQFTESSHFKAATEIEANAPKVEMHYTWSTRPGIANDAQWIWTENSDKRISGMVDTKVYCRKALGSVCPTVVVPDFETCAKTMECSRMCVKTYMAKKRGQCRGGCIGYAMIHDVGPDHCKECPCVMTGGFMDMINKCLANPNVGRPKC